MKTSYASEIELCEIHHGAIINSLSSTSDGKNLEQLKSLIEVALQPHDNDYHLKITNSGKALLVNRTKEFADKLNIEQDFILIRGE